MLYLVNSIEEIPLGTNFRVLGESLSYWDSKSLVETLEECAGLDVAPGAFPNGVPTDPGTDCIIPWQVREVKNG